MRTPRHLTIAILAAALLALAVAGCGGGGDDDSTATTATTETTPALSKADLIAQGDAICGEVNAAVGSAGSSEAEGQGGTTQVSDLYIGMVERLKGLGEPDDTAGYPELIASADELAQVEGELKLASEREDTAAAEAAGSQAVAALEGFQTQASAYGFQNCGEGPSAPAPSATPGGEEAEEGGIEVAPEEESFEEPEVEEVAPEEVAPETGGAGGGIEEAAPEAGGGETGGSSGGVGPG